MTANSWMKTKLSSPVCVLGMLLGGLVVAEQLEVVGRDGHRTRLVVPAVVPARIQYYTRY